MRIRLMLIVSLFSLFFILTPPFQLPDESDHYQYIFLLARSRYPRLIPDTATPGNQKILEVIEKVFRLTKVASEDFALSPFREIRNFSAQQNRSSVLPVTEPVLSKQGHQPPLYHIAASLVFRLSEYMHADLMTQFYGLRAVSGVFYLASIFLVYRLFRLLLKTGRAAENMTVFVAANPLMIKMGISINPDIALLFFSLCFLAVAVKSLKNNKIPHPLIFAGLTGLAILTKFQGVFLIPVYVLFLLMHKVSRRFLAQSLLLFSAGIIAAVLPWLLFNTARYGKPVIDNFALMCKQDLPRYSFFGLLWQSLYEFRHSFMHFAGFWGWGEPYPFKPFFLAYAATLGLTTVAGMYAALKTKKPLSVFLTGFIASLAGFLFSVGIKNKLGRFSCDIQGRYLLPLFPVAAFFVMNTIGLLFRMNEEKVARILMLFSLFHANLILWFVIIPKYYV